MSEDVWESPDGRVVVSSFVGPARDDGLARTRYQIAVVSDQDGRHHTASLDVRDFVALVNALEQIVEAQSWKGRR